ncbi:MAG: hypothetical protein LBF77_11510, partial [Spirochaetaceae bacterium]|nr:hypothetical protein [Spirochaetaceae bacterium]
IPGHIYAAFDTGIESGLAFDVGTLGEGKQGEGNQGEGWRAEGLIEHGGKLWMPVEVTVPGEGFYQAWRIGAREWGRFASQTVSEFSQGENSAQIGGEAKLYPMRESWAVYPPVTVPEAGDNLLDVPEEKTFTGAVEREMKKMEGAGNRE